MTAPVTSASLLLEIARSQQVPTTQPSIRPPFKRRGGRASARILQAKALAIYTQAIGSPAVTTTQTATERTVPTDTVNTRDDHQAPPEASKIVAAEILLDLSPPGPDTAGNSVPLGYHSGWIHDAWPDDAWFSWSEPFNSASPDTASNLQSASYTPSRQPNGANLADDTYRWVA